jgi:hypothetical protein
MLIMVGLDAMDTKSQEVFSPNKTREGVVCASFAMVLPFQTLLASLQVKSKTSRPSKI